MPTLLARRGDAQFAFASPDDPTKVIVFDAGTGDVLPDVPAWVIDGWSTAQPPGVDVVDTNTDAALEAAQARVAVLFVGPTNDNAAEKVDETGLSDGLPAWPGTEDELTLAAEDDVTITAGGAGSETPGATESEDGSSAEDEGDAPADSGTDAAEFTVTILEEGVPTIDGRIFAPNSVTWRQPPMPLMFTTENTGEGHKGAKLGGVITHVFRDGSKIKGQGRFDLNENGQELKRLVSPGPNGESPILNGFSADVGGALSEMAADENGVTQQRITQGRIMGGTVLPFQAFDDTRISVTSALGAEITSPETSIPEQQIQEPLKESDDDLEDAQQAAALGDIADQLNKLASDVEDQAQQESDEYQEDDNPYESGSTFASKLLEIELAVTSLANVILSPSHMTFEEERDDHGRFTGGGGGTPTGPASEKEVSAAHDEVATRNSANPQANPQQGFGWQHQGEYGEKNVPNASASHSFQFTSKNGNSMRDGSVHVRTAGDRPTFESRVNGKTTGHASFKDAADHVEKSILGSPGAYRGKNGKTR